MNFRKLNKNKNKNDMYIILLFSFLFFCLIELNGGKFLTKFRAADSPIRINDFKFCANPVTSDSNSWVIDVSFGGVVSNWRNRIICLQIRFASLLQCNSERALLKGVLVEWLLY